MNGMSTLVIACPICLQKIRAPNNVLGRQIKCPQCKNGFTAVDPAAVAPEPIAPAQTAARTDFATESEPSADPLGLGSEDQFDATPATESRPSVVDYLVFRRMITPAIVTGLFYFGVAVILLVGLVFAVMTLLSSLGKGGNIAVGLLTVLLDGVITLSSLVMWRVLCEVILVLFRILDQLREMNDRGG